MPEYYWFPACMLFTSYKAPTITLDKIVFDNDSCTSLSMRDFTSLVIGNKHLVNYDVSSSNPKIISVENKGRGEYNLKKQGNGTATITVFAEFMGLVSQKTFNVSVSNVNVIYSDKNISNDVYTSSGILLIRNATLEQIDNLSPGLYIIGRKKILKK